MLHPATELRLVDSNIGYGVFATAAIHRGTLTWVLDPLDQVLEPAAIRDLDGHHLALLEKYSWLTGTGQRILCWDFGRFMNHSCAPNSIGAGPDFEIAIRDIAPGQQLTNDYATLNLERPFTCHCDTPQCRHQVRPEDIEQLAAVYDAMVVDAIRRVPEVAQPLLPWLKSSELLRAYLSGAQPIPSILSRRLPSGAPVVAPWGPEP